MIDFVADVEFAIYVNCLLFVSITLHCCLPQVMSGIFFVIWLLALKLWHYVSTEICVLLLLNFLF